MLATGSIRMPAVSYGLWGMKATQNSFSMEGIVPGVKYGRLLKR